MTSRVLVKEEDLLPVEIREKTGVYVCGNYVEFEDTDPEEIRLRGLRLISISEAQKKRAVEEKEKQHEAWIVEKILPLALIMYNRHYDDALSLDQWMQYYDRKNTATVRWVKTAKEVYKHINPKDADK